MNQDSGRGKDLSLWEEALQGTPFQPKELAPRPVSRRRREIEEEEGKFAEQIITLKKLRQTMRNAKREEVDLTPQRAWFGSKEGYTFALADGITYHYDNIITHLSKKIRDIRKLSQRREYHTLWECWAERMILQNEHLSSPEDIDLKTMRWVYPCKHCFDRGRCVALNFKTFLPPTSKIPLPQIEIPPITPEYHIPWNVGARLKRGYTKLPSIISSGSRLASGEVTRSPLVRAFLREFEDTDPFIIPPRTYLRAPRDEEETEKDRTCRYWGTYHYYPKEKNLLKISRSNTFAPYMSRSDTSDAEIWKLAATLDPLSLEIHLKIRALARTRRRSSGKRKSAPREDLPEQSLWEQALGD